MATTKKFSIIGGLALLSGIGLMVLLHQFAWRFMHADTTNTALLHHGMRIPHEMPWFMPLGPLAMALTFAGAVVLVVSLVRTASRN